MAKISGKNSTKRRATRKKYLSLALVFSAILLVVTFITVYSAQQSQDFRGRAQTIVNCTVSAAELAINPEEQKMLDLVNAHRRANGKAPLKFSPSLNRAAAWMAKDSSDRGNVTTHTDSLGRVFQRLRDCGYTGGGTAENAFCSGAGAQSTFDGFKNSSGHNGNMLGNYTVIGIAQVGRCWIQDFGTVDDSGSSVIPTSSSSIPSPSVPSPVCIGSGSCKPTASPAQRISLPPANITTKPSSVPNAPLISTAQPLQTPTDSRGIIDILMGLLIALIGFLLGLFGLK